MEGNWNIWKHSNDSQHSNIYWNLDEFGNQSYKNEHWKYWGEYDITNCVPIIILGNDLSTLYAPLIHDGNMDTFYWQPMREELINIVNKIYQKYEISREDIVQLVEDFPNQALDF